jgi:hypothetical protein
MREGCRVNQTERMSVKRSRAAVPLKADYMTKGQYRREGFKKRRKPCSGSMNERDRGEWRNKLAGRKIAEHSRTLAWAKDDCR